METKVALDRKIADLLNALSTLSTSLNVTIASLDPDGEKYNVIHGRTTDHQDSIDSKIDRLSS